MYSIDPMLPDIVNAVIGTLLPQCAQMALYKSIILICNSQNSHTFINVINPFNTFSLELED